MLCPAVWTVLLHIKLIALLSHSLSVPLLANRIDDIPVSTSPDLSTGHFAPDLELNYSNTIIELNSQAYYGICQFKYQYKPLGKPIK